MPFAAMVAIARIVAIVLIGAGIAGISSLAGVRQLGFVAGVIAIGVGGVIVLASNQVSWLPSTQRNRDHVEPAGGLFGRGYGAAAVVGLLGAGLVMGSAISSDTVLIVAGLAGLIALALLETERRRPT
jgi:hypothetical protein